MQEAGEPVLQGRCGMFWSLGATRDYCSIRHHLSIILANVASSFESVEGWELVLGHQMEHLRLVRGYNLGIRKSILPVLLYLNRDDDCMGLICWWYRD